MIKNFKVCNDIIKIACSMAIGGGLSNLIDRICRGYVVDYIDINKIIEYPIFNIADIAIVIGIIIMIIFILKETIKKQENS